MNRLVLALLVVGSMACSSLLALNPTAGDTQQVRQTAARIADGVLVAEVALDATGQTLDVLPLSTTQKDAFDCGILKVNGYDAPNVTVLKVCGPIPPTAEAPVGKALQALRTATSHVGLCGTVNALLDALQPLVSRLEAAGVNVAVVKTALGFTLRFAGGCA